MAQLKFNKNAAKLDLNNALALAQASLLVYKDWGLVEQTVKNEWGLSSFKYFEGEFHTQAFMAADNDILFLVFRGTQPTVIEDWKTDFKIKLIPHPHGQIHSGFNQSLDTIWSRMKETFSSWHHGQTVWLTGHSLGGALATLAAERLARDNITVNGIYTFGQPMAADRKFVKKFNDIFKDRCHRFVNDQDIVTKVPGIPPYKHINNECYLDMSGKLHLSNIWVARTKDFINDAAGRSSKDAINFKLNNPSAIDDHSMKFYIKGIEQNLKSDVAGNKKTKSFLGHINS